MERALELAAEARGATLPNPQVGADVVREGRIVGEGYHHRAGDAHAEPLAIADAGELARGATIYVTLEPCSHYGRTPPCANAIIEAGISKAVIGMVDPSPQVHGRGIELMRKAGIEVELAPMGERAIRLTDRWVQAVARGASYVTLKMVHSRDGYIYRSQQFDLDFETRSQWIDRLRSEYHAILVGANTVRDEDPPLTVSRERDGHDLRQPIRMVLDDHLETDPGSRVYETGEVILATVEPDPGTFPPHVNIWSLPQNEEGQLSLRALVDRAWEHSVMSILVEGDAGLTSRFVRSRAVDEVVRVVAPVDMDGGISWLESDLKEGCETALTSDDVDQVGDNGVLVSYLDRPKGYS